MIETASCTVFQALLSRTCFVGHFLPERATFCCRGSPRHPAPSVTHLVRVTVVRKGTPGKTQEKEPEGAIFCDRSTQFCELFRMMCYVCDETHVLVVFFCCTSRVRATLRGLRHLAKGR